MNFKNSHLMPKTEIKILNEVTETMLLKYSAPLSCVQEIEISNRLKTTAGRIRYYKRTNGHQKHYSFRISLAFNNYKEFGFDSIKKTLIHELSHAISILKFDSPGHTEIFKKICSENSGTMNSKIAGNKYKEFASNDYCRTKYKYQYTCQCGASFKRKNKVKKTQGMCCSRCRRPVAEMKVQTLI